MVSESVSLFTAAPIFPLCYAVTRIPPIEPLKRSTWSHHGCINELIWLLFPDSVGIYLAISLPISHVHHDHRP